MPPLLHVLSLAAFFALALRFFFSTVRDLRRGA
jgi:hypothetical protein